jgi:hypothetical protein
LVIGIAFAMISTRATWEMGGMKKALPFRGSISENAYHPRQNCDTKLTKG